MSGRFRVKDGRGHGHDGSVLSSGAVVVASIDPLAGDVDPALLASRLIHTGLLADAAGSTDMNVDGSSTTVKFFHRADPGYLETVTQVRIVHHGAGMNITGLESRAYGSIAAPGLTNGLQLTIKQASGELGYFQTAVKKLGDWYRYSDPGSIVNDVDAISAGVDFFMATITLPNPVVLRPDTDDEISITVSDDIDVGTSGMVLFETQLTGWRQEVK